MIFSRLCFPYPVRICPPHMGTIPVPIEAAKLKCFFRPEVPPIQDGVETFLEQKMVA